MLVRNARLLGKPHTAAQIVQHIRQIVVIHRFFSVMHQAARHARLGNDARHLVIILQTPNVIDEIGARLQGGMRHRALIGIDGYRNIKVFLDRFNYRYNAGDFLLVRQQRIARPRRFAADIQNVRAVPYHILCVLECRIYGVPFSAVGKGIRRHVQNAHHIGVTGRFKRLSSNNHMFNPLL